MKTIYTFLLVFIFTGSRSQSFTNGTIFDYSVGDTLFEQYQDIPGGFGSLPPPTYIFRAITGKTVNASPASIDYEEHRIVNQYQFTGGTPPYTLAITNTIMAFSITNLQYVPINDSLPKGYGCVIQKDTTFLNNCGFYVHQKYYKKLPPPNTCFEPPTYTATTIEGHGIYTYTTSLSALPPGKGYESKLLWSHKVGKTQCGQRMVIQTGLNEHSGVLHVKVFPNPSEGNYFVECPTAGNLKVINAIGGIILEKNLNAGTSEIEMLSAPAGIYFIILNIDGALSTERVVRN
jgi:hypothetical protein